MLPPPFLDMTPGFLIEENPEITIYPAEANPEVTLAMVVSTTENVLSTYNPESSNIPHIILTDDEDPLTELEGLLHGSIKSSPKSAKSSSDVFLEQPLDVIKFITRVVEILNHLFDMLAYDRNLQDRLLVILDNLLNCQSQLPESAKLLQHSMKTTLTKLMTKFPSTRKISVEYEHALDVN